MIFDSTEIPLYRSQSYEPPIVYECTRNKPIKIPNTESRLLDELDKVYLYTKFIYQDLDSAKLDKGYIEAKILINYRLFSDEFYPHISIDPYGEFIFSHKSNKGYVDIGVRGEGELSYHVRNDDDPQKTRYEDYKWDENFDLPDDLYFAINSLKQLF